MAVSKVVLSAELLVQKMAAWMDEITIGKMAVRAEKMAVSKVEMSAELLV